MNHLNNLIKKFSKRVHGGVPFILLFLALTIGLGPLFAGETIKEGLKEIHPHWSALLPPLVAILCSLVTREVVSSLFIGLVLGSLIQAAQMGTPLFQGLLRTFDFHIIQALNDADHIKILIFAFLVAGMIQIVQDSGGTLAMVRPILNRATSRVSGTFSAYLAGLMIFFDDYANTLIVGNSFRPLFDKMKISREKLAYIVDSTAAPVAGIALISTWIGFELGQFKEGFNSPEVLAQIGTAPDPYSLFLQIIPYRFYCLLTLLFVFLVCILNRDFGKMHQKECEALKGEVLNGDQIPSLEGSPSHSSQSKLSLEDESRGYMFQAIVPIGGVLVLTLYGLLWSGGYFNPPLPGVAAKTIQQAVTDSSSYDVLIWASFAGVFLAMLCSFLGSRTPMPEMMESLNKGAAMLIQPLMILTFAWALSGICKELKTAVFIVNALKGSLPYWLVPSFIFLTSGVIAFCTGSSWATMGILIPLAIPLAVGLDANIAASLGAVLEGSIFGDHCSPLSDTTILSSMASGCNHLSHVETQMPYAVSVGVISLLFGYLPAGIFARGMGNSLSLYFPLALLTLGGLAVFFLIMKWGKEVKLEDKIMENSHA